LELESIVRTDWTNWTWLLNHEDDDEEEKKIDALSTPVPIDVVNVVSTRRRGSLPKPATSILKEWLSKHLDHPYPVRFESI
jgi:hypothetical protein